MNVFVSAQFGKYIAYLEGCDVAMYVIFWELWGGGGIMKLDITYPVACPM
jgi:hypothetical protein